MTLEVTNLGCARGGLPVLAGVSLKLGSGEAVILRGPNGSGKTTFLRTIAGLQPILSGSIDVAPDAIAYAAHADGLKATLTAAENLAFWAAIYGTSDIAKPLAAFELTELADRLAGNLSAGQKRRLGLARLLVTGRPIWALDEPTVSLDQHSVALFADVMRQHLQNGGSAIIATHIDLGLEARELDISRFRASSYSSDGAFDEVFT